MNLITFVLSFFADDLGIWQSWHDFFTNRNLDWTLAHWLANYDYAGYVILGVLLSLLFIGLMMLIFYRRRKRRK